MAKLKLALFVHSYDSGQALAKLYKALEFHDYTDYELEIINVIEEPIRAQSFGIIQTPTLLHHAESGMCMTSDFADIDKLRTTFGFKTAKKMQ